VGVESIEDREHAILLVGIDADPFVTNRNLPRSATPFGGDSHPWRTVRVIRQRVIEEVLEDLPQLTRVTFDDG